MTVAVETSPQGHYRVKHVAKSELVKIVTLRSTVITLVVTVVATLLVTALVTNSALHHGGGFYVGFDPTQQALIGLIAAALSGGVFGALLVTAEYSSGTIRTTLAAVPKRPILLATKIGVTALITIVFCEALSFASFFLGEAILSGGGAPSATLGSPGAFRAVSMTGLFIALIALMSFGFGLIFRSTAAAIGAFAGVVFVLPLVMHAISQTDLRYTPTAILTNSITSTVSQGPGGPAGPVSPVVGLLLMAFYAAIALAAGAVLFVRRDA
jgi:ABC-2 type transport system permease protein